MLRLADGHKKETQVKGKGHCTEASGGEDLRLGAVEAGHGECQKGGIQFLSQIEQDCLQETPNLHTT